jgi:hypothetical protein
MVAPLAVVIGSVAKSNNDTSIFCTAIHVLATEQCVVVNSKAIAITILIL